jgi:hypothetical protein
MRGSKGYSVFAGTGTTRLPQRTSTLSTLDTRKVPANGAIPALTAAVTLETKRRIENRFGRQSVPHLGSLFVFLSFLAFGQAIPTEQGKTHPITPPLDRRVERFDLKDGIFRDGIGELTSIPSAEFHIGFEEIIRDKSKTIPMRKTPASRSIWKIIPYEQS